METELLGLLPNQQQQQIEAKMLSSTVVMAVGFDDSAGVLCSYFLVSKKQKRNDTVELND